MVNFIRDSRSLNEILSEIGSAKKSILIGNGFNQAMPTFGKNFRWSNLRSLVEDDLDEQEKVILDQHDGQFESALERLSTTIETIEMLPNLTDDTKKLATDLAALRKSIRKKFFRAVLKAHPKKSEFAGPDAVQYIWVDKNFDYIFTLNYDLLMYWAVMGDTGRFHDGFGNFSGNLLWGEYSGLQKYFHLHGNLNYGLFKEGEKLYLKKHRHADIYEIENYINEDRCKIISECTSVKKMARLHSGAYSKFCAKKLLNVRGTLFTYGASFANDEHLLFIMFKRNPRFETVYIGVYDLENTGLVNTIKGKIVDLCAKNDIRLDHLPPIHFYETSKTHFSVM